MPTATLCTDEFAALTKRECGTLGLPEMPLAVLPHPTSALLGEAAQAKAREAVQEVGYILTGEADELAEVYMNKIYPAPKRAFRAAQPGQTESCRT
ncbi:MAG: hypothetical protein ETSY2_01870 [Candidatus Entotheonella gemina]|uniref:UGSC-like domain-containing protein n=1 Tax=Candidatus Entotheonella gemina TaxID=1429439 RepID=W4MH52_9BACT|nr:MAG: hypothetical protein ETSY2_01870 [Candidatus Entotheonella gemina]